MRAALLLATAMAATSPALAQDAPSPSLPDKPPGQFKPDESAAPPPTDAATPDTWIFSGTLKGSTESFSGTLVATKDGSQFEMKLGGGATCDGGELKGEVGLVRLPEITCTDDRKMRALFVPQGGQTLKVFGHVGEARFATEAHLLGTEALPEPKQTAQPKGPLGLPPPAQGGPPAPAKP